MKKETMEKIVKFALLMGRVTPKFVKRNTKLFIAIWGLPAFFYGMWLGSQD